MQIDQKIDLRNSNLCSKNKKYSHGKESRFEEMRVYSELKKDIDPQIDSDLSGKYEK